jgi:hypothetical protein
MLHENTKNFCTGDRVKHIGETNPDHYMTVIGYDRVGWCDVTYKDGYTDGHPDRDLELVVRAPILDERLFVL